MSTTRATLTPESAHFPDSNGMALSKIGSSPSRFCLLADASTDEYAYWTFVAPQGLSGALTAVVHYRCSNATSGTAAFQAQLEAVGDGEESATPSFDTVNAGTDTVPGTTTYKAECSISLSNDDSIAAGDLCRLSLNRDVSADSVANDLAILAVEIREA